MEKRHPDRRAEHGTDVRAECHDRVMTDLSTGDLGPDGWPSVPPGVVEHATRQSLVALDRGGADPVGPRMAAYYDVDGNFAGASFAGLLPTDPFDLTATDLHAVSLLSVDIGPGATRRMVQDGPARTAILDRLRAVPIVDLNVATDDDLEALGHFYDEVKIHLGGRDTKASNQWVTASKVCARKRPYLFPVRDSVVSGVLGLTRLSSYKIDLQVFRHLIGDPGVIAACDAAVDAAHEVAGDRRLVIDNDRLRVLDAALWTYGRRLSD